MTASESYLEARKILHATIDTHRLEFDAAPAAERIIERLGDDILVEGRPLSRYAQEILWIPYRNSDGATTSWTARIFPTPSNGPKFLTPKGGGGPPYIPPAVWAVVSKAHTPIILTEGPIKALACLQAGNLAIGLNGVFGAGSRDASDKINLHPLLAGFAWAKRSVYLAFDADLVRKFEVRRALLRTSLLLAAEGADVCLITSWDESDGKGIDDFLSKTENPAEQLELLVKDRTHVFSKHGCPILEKTPADLKLAVQELQAITLSRLQRSQIVRHLAKAVGVPVKELLDATSPPEEKSYNDREVNITDDTIPWDGPVDGIDLFKDIYTLLGRVMWMSDTARMTVTFWVIASVSFRVFRRFPYLRIKSPDRNCGKSTLIDLLAELVFKPLISADVSPAALYRLAEAAQPTILLDEFDNPEQIKDLTQLLNAGYDANRVAIRCNADKGTVERFRTFCPKVIASIKRLAETTESRSLPIDIQRVPADAERNLTELCDIDPAVFLVIKRKILAWVEDNLERIKTTRPERPDWLKTRDWDIWRPSFTVADVIGGPAPALALQAAAGVSQDRVVEQSLAIEILSCIREMAKEPAFVVMVERGGKDEVFLPSQTIIDFCNAHEEASWANWKTGDKPGLTIERLAKELRRQFKLQSEQVRYQNKLHQPDRHRGYWLATFEPLFASYLPPEDQPPPPEEPPSPPPTGASQASGDPKNGQEKGNSHEGVKTPLDLCHPLQVLQIRELPQLR